MSLNLIDKSLKSKYAEALYKNESSYDKEMAKQNRRLKVDFMRSNQVIDSTKTLFLNNVRQKRTKWIEEDQKFRDNYKVLCRKVHKKKLENLMNAYDKRQLHKLDSKSRQTFELLKQQLYLAQFNTSNADSFDRSSNFRLPSLTNQNTTLSSNITNTNTNNNPNNNSIRAPSEMSKIINNNSNNKLKFNQTVNRLVISDDNEQSIAAMAEANKGQKALLSTQQLNDEEEAIGKQRFLLDSKRVSSIPKLPKLMVKHHDPSLSSSLDNDLYTKYTMCDRLFLESLPAKVELTVTDVGKNYLYTKKHEHSTHKTLKKNFSNLQQNAVHDHRFNNLLSSLDRVKIL